MCSLLCRCFGDFSVPNNNFSSTYEFSIPGFRGVMEINKQLKPSSNNVPAHITLVEALSIENAIMGTTLAYEIERQLVNQDCERIVCPHCRGSKSVTHFRSTKTSRRSVTFPCPICGGTGFVSANGCESFHGVKSQVVVSVPPGVRTGESFTTPQLGNQIYVDQTVVTGDFILNIGNITTGNYSLAADHLELSVWLGPDEALNGFEMDVPYISGIQRIHIDRRGKLTPPGTKVRLPGLGLPRKTTAVEGGGGEGEGGESVQVLADSTTISDSTDVTVPKPVEREDLVVSFSLLPETPPPKEIPGGTLGPDGNIRFKSQEALDNFLKDREQRAKDASARHLLRVLEKSKKNETATASANSSSTE